MFLKGTMTKYQKSGILTFGYVGICVFVHANDQRRFFCRAIDKQQWYDESTISARSSYSVTVKF